MLAPLKNGELDPDLGERGVKGLRPSELWAPGVRGEEILPLFESDLSDLRSRLGTAEFRDGMLATTEDGPSKTRYARNLYGIAGSTCRVGSGLDRSMA